MDVIVRPARLSDIPFMKRLLESYLDFTISTLRQYSKDEIEDSRSRFCNQLENRLREESFISFVAEDNNRGIPLGFCLLEHIKEPVTGQWEIHINNIAVEKHAMGKMVSNKIVNRIHTYAEEKGIPVITGDIATSNRRSMMFAIRYFKYKPEKVVLLKFL
jgi:N-acetylglutamate synthase-like GNAT family acetyltransferase